MVWLRPLKLMTRLLELVASERSRCVEYLGALPFPGRTREGDERRVPMELAGEWVEGCPWICPPLRSVCRPVCNLVARPPRMLRSAAHSRHIVHPPPPRVSRPCPSVLPPLCIAALRTACPRGGPRSDAERQTATVIHHFPGPRAYHSFAREGVRQGARGNYPCEFRVSTGRAPSPPSSTFAARGAALHGQHPRFSFSMISPSNFVEERAPRLSAMGGRAGCNPDSPLRLATEDR